MESNKKKRNKGKIILFCSIGILVLLLVLLLVFHFTPNKNNKSGRLDIAPTKPIVIPTDEPLVTPTISDSAKTGWKTFVFSDPATQYSFNYPSTWGLVQIGHDNIVRLNFAGHCRVEFSTKASSQSSGISSQTNEGKTYAGRTFEITTSKKNNSPYLETYSLKDATAKDGFSVVTVDLPPSNTSQCQQTVAQILSTLTFK